MSLNYDKCINLTLNQITSSVKYMDGTLVPRKHEAMYLEMEAAGVRFSFEAQFALWA